MLSLAIITWWSWSTSVQRHREKDIDVSSMRCGACMLPVWNQVPVIGEPHVDIPLEHIWLEIPVLRKEIDVFSQLKTDRI